LIVYSLYWIKLPEHSDFKSEGYIGITGASVEKRFQQHLANHNMFLKGKYPNNRLMGHLTKYRDTCEIVTLCRGSKKYICDLERLLRPSTNIGWNTAIGGENPCGIDQRFTKEVCLEILEDYLIEDLPQRTLRQRYGISSTFLSDLFNGDKRPYVKETFLKEHPDIPYVKVKDTSVNKYSDELLMEGLILYYIINDSVQSIEEKLNIKVSNLEQIFRGVSRKNLGSEFKDLWSGFERVPTKYSTEEYLLIHNLNERGLVGKR
jgi:hypothetical protein